ncbi:hypothetical protein IP84_00890 [beta proteobacterium AAP99]|nr:hypothetical protein IP84_00890 [beta proteobacterium AAP99]
MLVNFFYHLKGSGVKVSVKEYLLLLDAMKADVIQPSLDEFYYLARMSLVKDESQFDKFDRAFGSFFKHVSGLFEQDREIPLEWLIAKALKELSEEERAALQKMSWNELIDTFKKRLEEQKERHEGGSRWIGTGGTSPFGNSGSNPQGIKVGGGQKGSRSAVKIWDMRSFRDYDDNVELGTRNIKVALRRLRRFAREGAHDELDMDGTIKSTAKNAGWLDIRMRPERHNTVKVLMLLDVGGTMDDHIGRVEELFSAAKSEFKHFEHYYFHNCIYDHLWKSNRRRSAERFSTLDVLRKYPPDYKLIIVGDATMSPYEILQAGGSVEYNNDEPGAEWVRRFVKSYPKHAWLNPEPEGIWQYRQSISILQQLMGGKMYPVTLDGLERAMRDLSK